MNILEEIVAHKKVEIKNQKELISFRKLEQAPYFEREVLSLVNSIRSLDKTSIITEFKKKSPSKGMINENVKPEEVTKGYAEAGASGLSVLTDLTYFGGSNEDLMKTREVNEIPILRKDFTVDEYQIIEAKAIGADAILLIAACLSKTEILEFARSAKSVNLQVILEIHELNELNQLNNYIDIVGVNNRSLKSFEVDINTSVELVKHIPGEFLKISESGISHPDTIKKLKDCGYNGFLIGENFMKSNDPAKAFKEFMECLK